VHRDWCQQDAQAAGEAPAGRLLGTPGLDRLFAGLDAELRNDL